MTKKCKHLTRRGIGAVATDRDTQTNRLIFSRLEQCVDCKEVFLEEVGE